MIRILNILCQIKNMVIIMFHHKSLVNGGVLEKVWKAANKLAINSDDECDLPETCQNLDTWINSNDFQVNKRLSLRSSATLINGAARVYQSGVCKLLEDLKDMDQNITRRKRERTYSSSDSYDSSECIATPEQMRRQTRSSLDKSYSPIKRTKIHSSSSNSSTFNYAISRSSNQSSTRTNMENRSHSSRSEPFSNNRGSNQESSPASKRSSHIEVSDTTEKETRDQGVQTSPRRERDSSPLEEDGLDKNFPFGYIIIHDNYYSRMPSKIILTSINSNVRNLI